MIVEVVPAEELPDVLALFVAGRLLIPDQGSPSRNRRYALLARRVLIPS